MQLCATLHQTSERQRIEQLIRDHDLSAVPREIEDGLPALDAENLGSFDPFQPPHELAGAAADVHYRGHHVGVAEHEVTDEIADCVRKRRAERGPGDEISGLSDR